MNRNRTRFAREPGEIRGGRKEEESQPTRVVRTKKKSKTKGP